MNVAFFFSVFPSPLLNVGNLNMTRSYSETGLMGEPQPQGPPSWTDECLSSQDEEHETDKKEDDLKRTHEGMGERRRRKMRTWKRRKKRRRRTMIKSLSDATPRRRR